MGVRPDAIVAALIAVLIGCTATTEPGPVGGVVGWCADGHEAICPAPAEQPAQTSPASSPATESLGDNLALGGTATASAQLPDRPASAAADGDPSTTWGAGADAPQWIEVGLGTVEDISLIRLAVEQFPDGATTHRVLGSTGRSELRLLGELSGATMSGQVLELTLAEPTPIRTLRVETTASPSWVSWREIELFH